MLGTIGDLTKVKQSCTISREDLCVSVGTNEGEPSMSIKAFWQECHWIEKGVLVAFGVSYTNLLVKFGQGFYDELPNFFSMI